MHAMRLVGISLFTLSASSAPAQAADIGVGISSYQSTLPDHRRCLRLGGTTMSVIGATQIQDWCDPANQDLLQADIFIKRSNGSKGGYLTSWVDFSCATERPQIPGPSSSGPTVESRLCP